MAKIGTCYAQPENPGKIMTLEERRLCGINVVLINLHWAEFDGAEIPAIRQRFNELYPDASEDGLKIILRIREGHEQKMMRDPAIKYSYGIGYHQGPAKPEYQTDWFNAVKTIAEALDEYVWIYQVGNEPAQKRFHRNQFMGSPSAFGYNASIAYDAIRKVNPDSLIAAPGDGYGALYDPLAQEYAKAVLPDVDYLDWHIYSDVWNNRNAWWKTIKQLANVAESTGKKWIVSEINKSFDFPSRDLFPVFAQLRTSEAVSYEKVEKELRLVQYVPYIQEECKLIAGVHIPDLLDAGAEACIWFGFENRYPEWWYGVPNKPTRPEDVIREWQLFGHQINGRYKCLYEFIDRSPCGVFWERQPVADMLRTIGERYAN